VRHTALLVILALTAGALLPACITRQQAEKALGHQKMAMVHFDQGQIPDAVAKLQESIKLNPHHPEAHHLLGNCFFALERYDDAHKEYAIATRLEPSFPDCWVNWGALMLAEERWEDSLEKFDKAIDDPTYREAGRALHNKGWALYQLGRFEEARECNEKVLEVTPLFCPSLHNQGMVAEAEGKLDEAEDLYQRALSCNGRDLKTWMALARLYIRLDRLQDAMDYLDFVIAHDEGGSLGKEAEGLLQELQDGRSGA